MATWQQIQEHVRNNYSLRNDLDDRFSLIWKYDDGRTHVINVHKYEAFGEGFLRFRTAVCKSGEMADKLALKKNASFAIGALSYDGDTLILEYALPLRGLDFSGFEIPLRVLPKTADALEATFSSADDVY